MPNEAAPTSSGAGHTLSVISSSLVRPGQWVECSCGWASPDGQFPSDVEAIEWARKEHARSNRGMAIALSARAVFWLAEELRNTADAIGPAPDLAERALRDFADKLANGTWQPFIDTIADRREGGDAQ